MFGLQPSHVFRAAFIAIVVVYLQVSIVSQFQLFSVRPELIIGYVVAVGIEGGQERAALAGFGTGLIFDLFVESPFGLTALVLCLVGYVAGLTHERLLSNPWWLNPVLAFVGTAIAAQIWVLVATLFGESSIGQSTVLKIALVAGFINTLVAPLMSRMARWILAPQLVVKR